MCVCACLQGVDSYRGLVVRQVSTHTYAHTGTHTAPHKQTINPPPHTGTGTGTKAQLNRYAHSGRVLCVTCRYGCCVVMLVPCVLLAVFSYPIWCIFKTATPVLVWLAQVGAHTYTQAHTGHACARAHMHTDTYVRTYVWQEPEGRTMGQAMLKCVPVCVCVCVSQALLCAPMAVYSGVLPAAFVALFPPQLRCTGNTHTHTQCKTCTRLRSQDMYGSPDSHTYPCARNHTHACISRHSSSV